LPEPVENAAIEEWDPRSIGVMCISPVNVQTS
jgi:hypothetical protein